MKVTSNRETASGWNRVRIEFEGRPKVLRWKTDMIRYPITLSPEDQDRGYVDKRVYWLGDLPEIEVVSWS